MVRTISEVFPERAPPTNSVWRCGPHKSFSASLCRAVGAKPSVGGTNGESHHFVVIRVRMVEILFGHGCKTQATDE
jgi:hypothetical protein